MLDVEAYISQFIGLLRQKYGARLLYVGLQGSYLRNEATESSDIDLMVVVDGLSVDDLDRYREAIISIGDCESPAVSFAAKQIWPIGIRWRFVICSIARRTITARWKTSSLDIRRRIFGIL